MPTQEPKPNRSMMEPAEDWYRCDAAEEDFFNSLLEATCATNYCCNTAIQVLLSYP